MKSNKEHLNLSIYRTKKILKKVSIKLREVRRTRHACIDAGYVTYYPDLLKQQVYLTRRKHIIKHHLFVLKLEKMQL